MQARQETLTRDDFSETAREFRQWRATRPRGARIPAGLWRSATALAEMHGVSRTSTALGLDYYALKKRLVLRSALYEAIGVALFEAFPVSLPVDA